MEEDVLEQSLAPQLGFKQRQGDGIPGGRKGLSKCGEVGEHHIRDQGLSPLCASILSTTLAPGCLPSS